MPASWYDAYPQPSVTCLDELVLIGSIPAERERVRLLCRPQEARLGAVGAQGSPLPVPQDHALPQDDRAYGGYGEKPVHYETPHGSWIISSGWAG